MQRHNLYPHKLFDSPKVENAYMYFKMTNVNNHFTVNQTHKNKWSQCVQKGEGQKTAELLLPICISNRRLMNFSWKLSQDKIINNEVKVIGKVKVKISILQYSWIALIHMKRDKNIFNLIFLEIDLMQNKETQCQGNKEKKYETIKLFSPIFIFVCSLMNKILKTYQNTRVLSGIKV